VADPIVAALGGAAVGAVVNHLLTLWRDSRARRADELVSEMAELRTDVKALGVVVAEIREKQAGIAAVVDGLVLAPRDSRPKRMR
jgi:hypothetical protein